MTRAVCDSSALIALLLDEPGAESVRPVAANSVVSTVNLAEIFSFFARRQVDAELIRQSIQDLGVGIVPFTSADAFEVGLMFPLTRSSGLSLGDRACLCLARHLNVAALTADRAWKPLGSALGVAVELIR